MKVIAYQTLENRGNIDEIEFAGPFDCTHKGAWLGRGSYFWDTNIKWAHEWGEIAYKKYKRDYLITETSIDLGYECFDLLGSVQCQEELLECINVMITSKKIKNIQSAVIPNIIQFMKEMRIFDYSSIRAADMYRGIKELHFKDNKTEFMVIGQRVQICVIKRKNVLLHPIRVVFPEN